MTCVSTEIVTSGKGEVQPFKYHLCLFSKVVHQTAQLPYIPNGIATPWVRSVFFPLGFSRVLGALLISGLSCSKDQRVKKKKKKNQVQMWHYNNKVKEGM